MRTLPVLAALLVLFLLLVPAGQPARAQTETPTPSPTPAYVSEVPLAPGVSFIIERRITYGEIAVTLAIGLLLLVVVVYSMVRVNRLWLR